MNLQANQTMSYANLLADFKQLRLNDTHSIGQQVKRPVAIYYGLGGAE